jgi:putative transposase
MLNGKQYFLTKLMQIYADGGYKGQDFAKTVKKQTGWDINIVKRSGNPGFTLLPKRWIVERTFAWLNKSRRLSKDYELRLQVSEVFIQMAMIRLMLRKMTKLT